MMSDWDISPRVARRLRNRDHLVAPEQADDEAELADDVPAPRPPREAGGSTTTAEPAPKRAGTTHFSIWDRRKEPKPDPEAIDIEQETNHAWWAQRENLQLLVNPKKRGAEARARRAAEAAFAPPGGRRDRSRPGAGPRPAGAGRSGRTEQSRTSSSMWDPSQVYSWSSPAESGTASAGAGRTDATADDIASPAEPTAPTPWDVLGLTSDATWAEVTRRHKQLAKTHHPDLHGGDEAARRAAEVTMSEINAAFADLRRIYQLTSGI